jgi:hypothetical protein
MFYSPQESNTDRGNASYREYSLLQTNKQIKYVDLWQESMLALNLSPVFHEMHKIFISVVEIETFIILGHNCFNIIYSEP